MAEAYTIALTENGAETGDRSRLATQVSDRDNAYAQRPRAAALRRGL